MVNGRRDESGIRETGAIGVVEHAPHGAQIAPNKPFPNVKKNVVLFQKIFRIINRCRVRRMRINANQFKLHYNMQIISKGQVEKRVRILLFKLHYTTKFF
jgi:hypothetical protein